VALKSETPGSRGVEYSANKGGTIMTAPTTTFLRIDNQIMVIDKLICTSIDTFNTEQRGFLSQVILKHLRDFAEHIMLKVYANGQDIDDSWDNIKVAVDDVKSRGDLKFLSRFHAFLQISESHYTLEEESSERLMLKYYEYLLRIRDFLKKKYAFEVLENISKFPLNLDTNMQEYYEKIATKIDGQNRAADLGKAQNDRYYIQKVKPFFVNQKIYYEVTFIPASGRASKFNRIIAFTDLDISKYYAVKLFTVDDKIHILGKTMPVFIIVKWEVAVRPCELENFSKILSANLQNQGGSAEYRGLMQYLTQTGFNLVELLDFANTYYQHTRGQILSYASAKTSHFFDLLDKCRKITKDKLPGCNVLRYLLYHLNNKVIRDQFDSSNDRLSGLGLSYGCIPFDQMPFNSSLRGHNPKLGDLFDCIDSTDRKHEILARFIRNNIEIKGQLYTSTKDLSGFDDIDSLIRRYNQSLYYKHTGRKIAKRNEHLYIRDYEDDTIAIIKKLIELSGSGVQNYTSSVDAWIASGVYLIDSDEKIVALQQMFEDSAVALIYGSAGTGKSTLINHISHFFSTQDKLYLANTNPAVDNLRRRVKASNCEFMTTTKFLKKQSIRTNYDLLIIDECSTVNNRDMKEILEKAQFDLLILVGDIYQIEAIQFGNWFSAARGFLPKTSIHELTNPWRSNNKDLLELWKRVRSMEETILELIIRQGYSVSLDASIFNPAEADCCSSRCVAAPDPRTLSSKAD
jgi:energy-coupling factor transporter ATP-binding protein EcfA2